MYLYEHKLPIGGHGAMMETSKMLYLEPAPGVADAGRIRGGADQADAGSSLDRSAF